jgi:hypothetical protein
VTIPVGGADVMTPGRPLSTQAWYELRPRRFAGSLDDAAREFRDLFDGPLLCVCVLMCLWDRVFPVGLIHFYRMRFERVPAQARCAGSAENVLGLFGC